MPGPRKLHIYIFLIILLGIGMFGCAPPLLRFDADIPSQTLTFAEAPPIHDARVRFREIFCELLSQKLTLRDQPINCENYLWCLSDEPEPSKLPRPAPAHDTRFRFLLVPGAFAECAPKIGLPFETGTTLLSKIGYRIDRVFVSGRSSSNHNAGQIATAVAEIDIEDSNRLVLIGYSKGATDILHFLVNYPELSEKVTAFLSVAGAINGTPLADAFADTYLDWFAKISLANCGPGDKGVLESLKRSNQLRWLAAHPLPRHVHYFSIVSFANRDRIQPLLHTLYDLLASVDPRNDGQLIFYDQVIPGATLLGYVNLDHWDVVTPVRKGPSESTAAERSLLRDILFEAMILFLVESFQESP